MKKSDFHKKEYGIPKFHKMAMKAMVGGDSVEPVFIAILGRELSKNIFNVQYSLETDSGIYFDVSLPLKKGVELSLKEVEVIKGKLLQAFPETHPFYEDGRSFELMLHLYVDLP